MESQQNVKKRMQKNAKNLRFISRDKIFELNRKQQSKQISYMKYYNEQTRKMIKHSIEAQIPEQLPPLSVETISFYRRANRPIYQTKKYNNQFQMQASTYMQNQFQQNFQFDPHMTYQSLWIFAGIEGSNFPNYQSIVKQFQRDLPKYLSLGYNQIKQMAVIVAGNKIIGNKQHIKAIVDQDKKQLWVMINHIYDGNMSLINLFPYLKDQNQIIFRTIFQMSNFKGDQVIDTLIKNQQALGYVVMALKSQKNQIKKMALWIVGNILGDKGQYVKFFQNYKILDLFRNLLNSNDQSLRKDTCWAISNYAFEKNSATDVAYNLNLFEKLIQLFLDQQINQVRIQLGHIFSHLITYADKRHMFQHLNKNEIIQRCSDLLNEEDSELNMVILYFIQKLIQLGGLFEDQQEMQEEYYGNQKNQVIIKIYQSQLKKQINVKSFSNNKEISQLSSAIMDLLEQQE